MALNRTLICIFRCECLSIDAMMRPITPLLVLFCFATVCPADRSLWYDRPAEKWSAEALPLGNGRLGCMIFGGVERERIQFNEDSLWTGDENPSGNYDTMGAYQAFGDLLIEFEAAETAGQYARTLSLDEAMHRVAFQRNGVTHTRTTFVSHPDQVIVVRWSADKPGSITGRLRLRGTHGETPKAEGNEVSFSGELSNKLAYEARARVIAKGGATQAGGDAIQLNQCDEVTVLLAAGTSYVMDHTRNWRGEHPKARIATQVDSASKRPWQELRDRHVADYKTLFDRAGATWGRSADDVKALPTNRRLEAVQKGGADPELEQLLFQYGRYLLIASSRRPGLPANLQGLWNDSNSPPWHSDYHTNINIQMNYWPAEVANLAECHLPLFDLIRAMEEPSRKATQAAFGKVRGWTARTSHNIFGGHGWQWNIPANAWYAQHFFEHYAFGRDEKFLRETAYPVLKEACQFWEDHLKKLPDGTLVVPNGWSPEHGPREDGVAHDQQIVWDLFTNHIAASTALGVDEEYRAKIAAMRDQLAGPKVGRWGQLQEWIADRDDPKDQHRHTSHLFAVYPGTQISVSKTPQWAKAAAISLEARGTSGDSRREWAWAWRSALWARLQQPEKSHEMIRNLLTHNTLPNLLGNHPPMQMDGNWGITAGICEMLMQSHADEIHLLPALPKAWQEGSFRGLRARGGFEVDASWKDGKVTEWRVTSPTAKKVKLRVNGEVKEVEAQRQ